MSPKSLIAAVTLMGFLLPGYAMARNTNDPTKSDFFVEMCKKNMTYCSIYAGGYRDGVTTSYFMAIYDHLIIEKDSDTGSGVSVPDHIMEVMRSSAKRVFEYSIGCIPEKDSNDKIAKIWINYLKGHPKEHRESPESTLMKAVEKAFPCK
ncbi:MAG: Rap1a/Tai family immunity protein [Rhodospirillales bacterium]|jgi:hypothetical protein|nr:Rap1a/Tai family immunity protein [Rhodospirillales bacterium]